MKSDDKWSQLHTQNLLNSDKGLSLLAKHGIVIPENRVISPLESEKYHEYENGPLIERVEKIIDIPDWRALLQSFWPSRSQHWDGVAVDNNNRIVLFEAKAYIGEAKPKGSEAENVDSVAKIKNALLETANFFGAEYTDDAWFNGEYQFANRLAMSYFLNYKLKVNAKVYYVIFLGDTDTPGKGLETENDWAQRFKDILNTLGFSGISEAARNCFLKSVEVVYISINDLYGKQYSLLHY